jgi:hypothetical protein
MKLATLAVVILACSLGAAGQLPTVPLSARMDSKALDGTLTTEVHISRWDTSDGWPVRIAALDEASGKDTFLFLANKKGEHVLECSGQPKPACALADGKTLRDIFDVLLFLRAPQEEPPTTVPPRSACGTLPRQPDKIKHTHPHCPTGYALKDGFCSLYTYRLVECGSKNCND